MAAPPKVSLYSINELKTTLDDHLPVFLSSSATPSGQPLPRQQRYTPVHTLIYTRLALGYAAVAIALYLSYLDYIVKQPFEETKTLAAAAVVAYFALNGAFTGWLWFVERGLVFDGARGGGSAGVRETIQIRSLAPSAKYTPLYRVAASWTTSAGTHKKEAQVPMTGFFSSDGFFVAQEFENWLRRELPVIVGGGEAESKKVS